MRVLDWFQNLKDDYDEHRGTRLDDKKVDRFHETPAHTWTRFTIRLLQFSFGVTIVGIYTKHLVDEHSQHKPEAMSFLYSIVYAAVSSIMAIILGLPWTRRHKGTFPIDWMFFVLWIVVFSTLAHLCFGHSADTRDAMQGTSAVLLKNALWVDLVNVGLWLTSAIVTSIHYRHYRRWSEHLYIENKEYADKYRKQREKKRDASAGTTAADGDP